MKNKQAFRKLLQNQKDNKSGLFCEKILGDSTKVNRFAQFWRDNKEDLAVIGVNELFEFSSTQAYSRSEIDFYRIGLKSIGQFFEKCYLEVEAKREQEKLRQAGKESSQVSEIESEI
jgi:hypothetical protein